MKKNLDQLVLPWVRLCLIRGVGFAQAQHSLRSTFVQQAKQELRRRGYGVSFAALSLLSGLSHAVVRDVMDDNAGTQLGRSSPIEQVMLELTRGDWPITLVYKDDGPSFTALVRSVHLINVSPRAILLEMKDRGLVSHKEQYITLLADVGGQSNADQNSLRNVIGAVTDHANVVIDNLQNLGVNRLKQSLICDGLTAVSVEDFHALAWAWWVHGSKELSTELKRLDAADADRLPSEHHRVRTGVYFHDEPLAPPQAAETDQDI